MTLKGHEFLLKITPPSPVSHIYGILRILIAIVSLVIALFTMFVVVHISITSKRHDYEALISMTMFAFCMIALALGAFLASNTMVDLYFSAMAIWILTRILFVCLQIFVDKKDTLEAFGGWGNIAALIVAILLTIGSLIIRYNNDVLSERNIALWNAFHAKLPGKQGKDSSTDTQTQDAQIEKDSVETVHEPSEDPVERKDAPLKNAVPHRKENEECPTAGEID